MTELIRDIFSTIFGDNVILATIIIAMLPIIELRGAIPFAMSIEFWGINAINNISAFLWSFLGSSFVVPIIALVFIPFVNWLKRTKLFSKFALRLESRIKQKTDKINKDAEEKSQEHIEKVDDNSIAKQNKKTWLRVLGLFLFVAVPLPLTGVWTGTCISVMLGFNFWQTCAIVIGGNLMAGLIVTFVCSIFPAFTTIILYIFIVFVIVFLLYGCIKRILKKKNTVN